MGKTRTVVCRKIGFTTGFNGSVILVVAQYFQWLGQFMYKVVTYVQHDFLGREIRGNFIEMHWSADDSKGNQQEVIWMSRQRRRPRMWLQFATSSWHCWTFGTLIQLGSDLNS